ncbi:MAG: DMT family transporter [Sphingomonadales bacterium]|nr:DMT family transporter [Sphingomonadales bacterium]
MATLSTPSRVWRPAHVAALVGGNVALALGPWWVRLADSGPVSAGFWRLFLALPVLFVLARANRQPVGGFPRGTWLALAGAGAFFALDLASWHLGIGMTRLGNAALFGNAGSVVLMAWGLIALRRRPHRAEAMAFAAALAGTAILMGRSLELGAQTLMGDALCLLAGLLYAGYIMLLQGERARFGSWSLLALSSAAGAPVLLAVALLRGEPVWPHHWGPLLGLALTSQMIGQGLLVYALGHFRPLVIGLALLTQPAVAALAGWLAFGERLGLIDVLGMALIGAALVLARLGEEKG